MRKKLYLLAILILTFNSCKRQKEIVNLKQKDMILFNFINKNIKSISPIKKISISNDKFTNSELKFSEEVYNKNNNIIHIQKWQNYGINYIEKPFSFVQNKDTMNVNCICGQNRNYFFKNFKFMKGNYVLSFDYPKKYNEKNKVYKKQIKYVNGKEIQDSLKIQNILPKNKKFIYINISDTLNVKLKKS